MIAKFFVALAVLGTFVNAQQTTCTFQFIGTTYTCMLENQVVRNENDLEQIGGVHVQGFGDADVRRINQTDSTVHVFPTLMIDNFVNLFNVRLIGVEMRILNRFLTNCARLSQIDLMDNEIEAIPAGIFRNCPRINGLNFRNNRIRTIHENAFQGVSELQTLILSGNGIVNVNRNLFSTNIQMRWISLDENEIQEINSDTFADLPQLRFLDLRNNAISSWSLEILSQNQRIEELRLGGNQITTLDASTFSNLPNLVTLSIGELERIPTFEGVSSLITLEINNSPVTSITAASFIHMTSLRNFFMMNGQLESVDFSMTNPQILGSLQTLALHNNSISNLEDSSFQMLTGVTSLGLNRNQIERLQIDTLGPMLPLNFLSVENNRISRIDREILERSPNMRIVAWGNQCFSGTLIVGQDEMSRLNRCFNSGISLKINGIVIFMAAFVALFVKH